MNVDGFIFGGGRTPLMWAAFLGNEPMAKLLLERGAKIDTFTPVGSALGQAAWGGHVGMARLLLDAGAPVDQRDLIANYTPLHWAASSELSSPALVELLLSRHADVNAEGGQPVDNFLGVTQTPLMLARKRGDTPIVQALLKAGAEGSGTRGQSHARSRRAKPRRWPRPSNARCLRSRKQPRIPPPRLCVTRVIRSASPVINSSFRWPRSIWPIPASSRRIATQPAINLLCSRGTSPTRKSPCKGRFCPIHPSSPAMSRWICPARASPPPSPPMRWFTCSPPSSIPTAIGAGIFRVRRFRRVTSPPRRPRCT